jgi:hypothetical protein
VPFGEPQRRAEDVRGPLACRPGHEDGRDGRTRPEGRRRDGNELQRVGAHREAGVGDERGRDTLRGRGIRGDSAAGPAR